MFINLNTINESGIVVDQDISFDEDNYKTALIKGLESVHVKGRIYYSTTKEVLFDGSVNGDMLLLDSNNGEIINYPFSTEISEILSEDKNFCEELRSNNQNSLDLKEILWQNIVLEVPLNYSKTDKVSITKGDGWELKSESEVNQTNNPFKDLLDIGKEWYYGSS